MKSFARGKSATFRIYQKSVGTSFKFNIAAIEFQFYWLQILKELFQALKSGWLLFVVFRLASQLLHGCKRLTLFPLFYQKMHCRQKYCKNRSRREREATIRGLTCLCRGTHKSGRLVRIYSLALFRAFHVVRLTLCMLMGIFKMPYAYLKSKEISKPHLIRNVLYESIRIGSWFNCKLLKIKSL